MADRTTVRIREYRPDDRDAIMSLAPRLTDGVAAWRDSGAVLAAVQEWVASSADTAASADHAVYVALDDADKVVGLVTVGKRTHFAGQTDAYVGELITAAGMERRGIARALMQAAEAWGRAQGLDYLTLETGAANQPARAFYAAIGYQDEDVRLTKRIAHTLEQA